MANEVQLRDNDGQLVMAWMCGVCKRVYPERTAYCSAKCCTCLVCGKVADLVDDSIRGHVATVCRKCWGPYYAKIDSDRLDRAELIEDYSGPVCIGDRYFPDPEEAVEYLADSREGPDMGLPEFVHTCKVIPYSLDAVEIVNNLLENAGVEDSDFQDLDGVKEFEKAVDAFNKANEQNVYWEEDSHHKCRLTPIPAADEVQS